MSEPTGDIPLLCPQCGAGRENFVADYYESVRQGIYVTEEEGGAYDYDGAYESYDDGSTGDEAIRCTSCWNEIVVFGHFEMLTEVEYTWLLEKRRETTAGR